MQNLNSPDAFDPGELALLRRVFDDVWNELAPHTGAELHNATKNAIAAAIMHAAIGGERDPERLWCYAMARSRALSTIYWRRPLAPA